MLVDSHCHLNFPELYDDFEKVMKNATDKGIGTLLTISTSISGFAKIAKIIAKDKRIYASIGIHPSHVLDEGGISWQKLVALCAGERVVGIGETGLDYHYPNVDKDAQKANFIEHIKAAQYTGLPLIVHTREADKDTLEILSTYMKISSFKCLIHCFTSSAWLAQECLKLGCFISVSGIITFKNALELQTTVKEIPLDRLLVETDSPYLAPMPFRGQRNEPAFVKYVAEGLAKLKEVSYDEVVESTSNNFYSLFNKVIRP